MTRLCAKLGSLHADSGFFKNYLYQGGVKSTVSWVFEDLKSKISEDYDQNWCFPDSAQLAVTANWAESEKHQFWSEPLLSRQLPSSSHDFFHIFSIFFLFYLPTQNTIALTFLTHIISGIGGVPSSIPRPCQTLFFSSFLLSKYTTSLHLKFISTCTPTKK